MRSLGLRGASTTASRAPRQEVITSTSCRGRSGRSSGCNRIASSTRIGEITAARLRRRLGQHQARRSTRSSTAASARLSWSTIATATSCACPSERRTGKPSRAGRPGRGVRHRLSDLLPALSDLREPRGRRPGRCGRENKSPHNYWFVCPNYYDVTEWPFGEPTKPLVGYFGRICAHQGLGRRRRGRAALPARRLRHLWTGRGRIHRSAVRISATSLPCMVASEGSF
jgi:hypothetical protein